MSKRAGREHRRAKELQDIRDDARGIMQGVKSAQAKSNRDRVSRRWPFELFQNAHDAGPRTAHVAGPRPDKKEEVHISLSLSRDTLEVRHDGKPFNVKDRELAALTSGGSSKEWDGPSTGRFGTGFLTTHALSTKVDLTGVLETGAGYERFEISLDRSGDETQIADNVKDSKDAIDDATPCGFSKAPFRQRSAHTHGAFGNATLGGTLLEESTALFRYLRPDLEVAKKGIAWLRKTLPYLYATCPNLGTVSIDTPDFQEEWALTGIETEPLKDGIFQSHDIEVLGRESSRRFRCLRVSPTEDSDSALLIVLEQSEEGGWRVRALDPESPDASGPRFPRIFVQFPLVGSEFLPFNVVLEGDFEPEEKRDALLMEEKDETLIEEAFSLLPAATAYAAKNDWEQSSLLADLAPPHRTFSNKDEATGDEGTWWHNLFAEVAEHLAKMPIIQTRGGNPLPAVAESESPQAHFLHPGFSLKTADEINPERFHELAGQVQDLHPVVLEQTGRWAEIAKRWDRLGVDVERISLEELTNHIRENAARLSDLPIRGDEPSRWLVQLFQLMADLSGEHKIQNRLKELVPNQNGALKSPSELFVDPGISRKVKDIATSIHDAVPSADLDPRTVLLCSQTQQHLMEPEMEEARELLRELTAEPKSETWVIDHIIDELRELLPNGAEISEDKKKFLCASTRLIAYLCQEVDDPESEVDDPESRVRKCPLLTKAETITHLADNTQIMAPVEHWPDEAQRFSDLYAPKRVLASFYSDEKMKLPDAISPLAELGVVIESPLFTAPRSAIPDDLLAELAKEPSETSDVIVKNERFSRIALLDEILGASRRDKAKADLLLDFVLNYAAANDSKWRSFRNVEGRREGDPVPLEVREAIWPAELSTKAWIPKETKDGETNPVAASAGALNDKIKSKPQWLQGNQEAINLLHECFGLSKCELRLSTIQDEAERKTADANAAALMQAGAGKLDADMMKSLTEEVEKKRERNRQKEQNKQFGVAVQNAVGQYLREKGFDVQLIDYGFDLDVSVPEKEFSLENFSYSFDVGDPYLVEVKATTIGEVKLTSKQAETASTKPEQFVLCVVDLSEFDGDPHNHDWTTENIEPLARVVKSIGQRVSESWEYVDLLTKEDNEVRITEERKLRYDVSPELWEEGVSIKQWTEEIKPGSPE